MAAEVTVDAQKAIAHFGELGVGLRGFFAEDALEKVLDEQIDESQLRVPKDTGVLHDSIEGIVSSSVNLVSGIYQVAADYGIYVEFPTTRHFVPERYIGDWAVRHGFKRGGLIVSGKAQPFVRRNESETLQDVAERMGEQTVKGIKKKIKEIF
jgi:hypothetical protein